LVDLNTSGAYYCNTIRDKQTETNVGHTIKPPVVLSLCTGMRGLERGIERAIEFLRRIYGVQNQQEGQGHDKGVLKVAANVEIESFVALNLVKQMEQGVLAPTPIWTDLKTFPYASFYGKVHIITAGYPCQPFSQAGKQRGVNDSRHLFPYIDGGIEAIQPVIIWLENVANHLNLGYREVRERLQGLGYTVKEGIFSAEQVGAPHLRKRLFILAVADAYCTEQSKIRGDLREMLGIPKSQCQSEYSAPVFGGDGEKLGNTECKRLEGRLKVENIEGGSCSQWLSPAGPSNWPARPCARQHEWEHPRLEQRLGFAINGYNYSEDLLRMAGNAVVEQQAEFAFLTLLHEHGII